MKQFIMAVCAVTTVLAQFNESGGLYSYRAYELSTVSSSFTDINRYNTFSHATNPIGLFETQDALLNFTLGHRYLGWHNRENIDSAQTVNSFILPQFVVGTPGKMYLGLNYALSPTVRSDKEEQLAMPLNNFGLFLIGQTEEARFQFGIKGQGYYGKQTTNLFDSLRVIMGVDEVGVCLGSQLHEAVRLNCYAHAAGFFDSLFTEQMSGDTIQWPQERFAWLKLPQIDVSIDVGMDDFPYHSNFCFTYARHHFVYTLKADGVKDPGSHFHQVAGYNGPVQWADADPIVTDSMGWQWQNLWDVRVHEALVFRPALLFGYWQNRCKRMTPGSDNHPINYDGERKGYTWETSSFHFGVGNTFVILDFSNLWFEYSRATLALDITGKEINADEPEKSAYNRIGFGLGTALDKLGMPESMGLYFSVAFLYLEENALYTTYRLDPFQFMYDVGVPTQLFRYQPWEVMKNRLKTTNLSFGLGASFLDTRFETGVHLGILRQKYVTGRDEQFKGVEFGIDLKYAIPSR